MEELKRCPFCGGEAELLIVPGYFKQGLSSSGWVVKCLNGCCNQMPFQSDHDAVEAWNRRDVRDAIMREPTAGQEIIHCKDCKHYGRLDKRRFYRGMDCLNKHIDTIVPDVDFCSKAERRDDG